MDMLCFVDGCDRPVLFKRSQMCRPHRQQHLAGAPFTEVKRRVPPGSPCAFGPCDKPSKNQGWCKSHYDQQLRGRPMRMTKARTPVHTRDEAGNKWCYMCEAWCPESGFASSSGKGDGLQSRCRACNAAIYRGRSGEIRDKMREYRLNITREAFDAMFAAQGSACAICRGADPGTNYWAVDHDHACCSEPGRSCGRCIRGILCSRCNQGIGFLRDDPSILDAAAGYLRGASRLKATA